MFFISGTSVGCSFFWGRGKELGVLIMDGWMDVEVC